MGKTLKYGSHEFPAKHGFTRSATGSGKVSVAPHARGSRIIADHVRASPKPAPVPEPKPARTRPILKLKYGGDTSEGGAHGFGGAAGAARSGGRGAMGNHSGAASAGATGGDIGTVSNVGSRYGNENAAIGVLTKANPNPTAIRDVMGGYNDNIGAAVSARAGMATPEAVDYAENQAVYGKVLGALISLAHARMKRSVSLDSLTDKDSYSDPASVVNTGFGIAGMLGTNALGAMSEGVQEGISMADLNKAQESAIRSGLVGGNLTESKQGTIASETGGTGLSGPMNSGQTDISKVEGDINRGSFTGDLGDYGRSTAGPGNQAAGNKPVNGALRTLANAQPMLSSAPVVRPIIPTQTQQFRRGGKPAFNHKPLVGS